MAIVYFGTFDPFHENHFRLVHYISKKYQPKKIAIIPNSDLPNLGSGFKKGALSLKHRLAMIKLRFSHLEPEYASLQKQVEIKSPENIKTNWQGRQKLACQFGKENHLPVLYVVLGLDSLISSLSRSSEISDPLDRFVLKILAIPRIGYEEPSIPMKYRDKIVIDRSYRETYQISSTLIRQLIRNQLPIETNLCHQALINYLIEHHCYDEKTINVSEFQFVNTGEEEDRLNQLKSVIVFMGAPGSGKTTLARALAEKEEMLFISTGDIYRNEVEANSEHYRVLQSYRHNPLEFRQVLGQFILFKIRKMILENKNNKVIIEGFKAGDLTHWVKHFGSINHLIYVQVEKNELIERLKKRNDSRKEELDSIHRIDSYFNIYEGEILVEINALLDKQSIKSLIKLENNDRLEITQSILYRSLPFSL